MEKKMMVKIIETRTGETLKVIKNVWAIDSGVDGLINIWYYRGTKTEVEQFKPNHKTWIDISVEQ